MKLETFIQLPSNWYYTIPWTIIIMKQGRIFFQFFFYLNLSCHLMDKEWLFWIDELFVISRQQGIRFKEEKTLKRHLNWQWIEQTKKWIMGEWKFKYTYYRRGVELSEIWVPSLFCQHPFKQKLTQCHWRIVLNTSWIKNDYFEFSIELLLQGWSKCSFKNWNRIQIILSPFWGWHWDQKSGK